jgi:uncharacterized cupin superfamily protein
VSTFTHALTTVDASTWERFQAAPDVTIGEVHWLTVKERENGTLATGLWRIGPEEGAEIPYAVAGSETFHVLEGEAELETPDGERISLTPGTVVSFPDGFTATWRTRSPFKKFFVVA